MTINYPVCKVAKLEYLLKLTVYDLQRIEALTDDPKIKTIVHRALQTIKENAGELN